MQQAATYALVTLGAHGSSARVRCVWCSREDERMRVPVAAIWVLWCCGVQGCVLLVVRDLRSGDDGDHLGAARNLDGDRRLGNSNQPVLRLQALIFDACATLSRLASQPLFTKPTQSTL